MNGSISKGRESVWAILERLGHTPSPSKLDDKDKDEADASLDENIEVSSVMICCPLQPAEDSEVEIARSEVVSIDIEMEKATPTAIEKLKERGAALHLWPLGQGKGKERSDNTNTNSPPREQPKTPRTKVKDVRVWHPSRTKVSLQAAWWGYRIYLPPPVMRVLSDKTLEAAKRAAMITAALTWLVSHIPTTMLPPQLRTVVEVVKGIVPILGYVGGFIAWSWNTVQSFDKGQGVILSATWLLPVALVPGTWFYTEPPNDSSNDSEGLSATSLPPSPPPKDPPTQPVR
ncbi:hypothetical protein K439DRAFT_1328104 [Ramaria rubella]|nr:hypothetical protein K439DRAFT_1328104 [Ramaria rubella]